MNTILVQLAKNGSNSSFIKIIKLIELDLYNIAKTKLENIDDIDDVIQDTILDIYESLHTLKNNSCFKSWCIKILINNCNDKIREKYNSKNVISYNEIEDYLEEVSNEEDFNKLYSSFNYDALMEVLSEREQLVFSLYYEQDIKINEISKILDIKSNTIKSIIKRGKEKILKKYGKDVLYG